MSVDTLTSYVVGDVALVLLLSSLLGAVARRCHQPVIIAQIAAGILLGPTVLGQFPGHLTHRIFPPEVLPYLSVLAQVAVVIFMFVVGYEVNFRSLRGSHRAVPLVAGATLLVPFALGIVAAIALRPLYVTAGEHQTHDRSFLLFIGIATSVSALPVLAAILRERRLADTTAGVVAITCAGIMDVLAWLVLAAATAGAARAHQRPWPVTALLVGALALGLLIPGRRLLNAWAGRPGRQTSHRAAVAMMLAMGTAWATAGLGLHAVFGGFIAGLAMRERDGVPDEEVVRSMETAGYLLLPLFFVVTGLSLNLGALRAADLGLLAVVLLTAGAGKLVPGYVASRLGGLGRTDAATVAVLLNTRGLTELVVLNIGKSAGLIHQRLFTILVLMALITTVLTSPLLSMVRPSRPQPATEPVLLAEGEPSVP